MKTWFDITPTVSEKIGVFPGDVEFRREVSMDFAKGDHLTLSAIRTTLHLGAHADAPNHYVADGAAIHERSPMLYIGKCLVLDARSVPRGARVEKKHLSPNYRDSWPAPRILLRTDSFPDPDHWNSDFSSYSPELIEAFAKAGVRLIGIDTPSIDPEDSKTLDSHKMVARHDLAVLEGLVLTDIEEGLYTLIAPPLKLKGADAAPVRAVLLKSTAALDEI